MPRRRASGAGVTKVKAEGAGDRPSVNPQPRRSRSGSVDEPLSQAEEDDDDDDDEEAEDDAVGVAEADSQGYWEALEIIDETAKQYFIRWAGTDEQGQPWPPSWEPKGNANAKLIEAWKKHGKKKLKEKRAAEKEAKKAKKQAGKQKKAKGKQIMKTKEETHDPQVGPHPNGSRFADELKLTLPRFAFVKPPKDDLQTETASNRPASPPALSKTNRKRVVPDSEASSQPVTEAHQSKKQKSDARPPKQVTFELVVDSSPLSSVPSSRGRQASPEPTEHCDRVGVEATQPEIVPVASSGESSVSIVPDSQPAPTKDIASPSPEPELLHAAGISQGLQISGSRANEPVAGPSHSQSFPSMDSPGTNHSDLESDVTHGDDDVPIFNDYSQHDDDVEEEKEENGSHSRRLGGTEEDTHSRHHSPMRTTIAVSAARPLGRVPIPRAAAFFPPQPESSQFDPIEDPDSSPFRPARATRTFERSGSPLEHPRPSKTRLELVLGPSEDDEVPSPLSSFQAELIAAAALSYVSPEINVAIPVSSTRPLARTGPGSQTLKRPASRPIIAPISIEVDSGAGVVSRSAYAPETQPFADVDASAGDDEDDDDGEMDLGGFNEDYFACDLLATQQPIEFDDVVDYERAVAGQDLGGFEAGDGPESQAEAVDAGEGAGGGGGSAHGNGAGGYPYSGYPSEQTHHPSHHGPSQAYNAPGPSSVGAESYRGSSGYGAANGGHGGAPGGYPYPSHFQTSHQSAKREYEDDREESAKRARMEQQQQQQQQHHHQQQQQQQQYYQQQQQQARHYPAHYAQPQAYSSYPPPNRGYPPNQAAPHHYSPPPPQQGVSPYNQSATYPAQYQQLPPMQTSPPPVQAYSRSSSQLPSLQHALSNEGYPHQPAPTPAVPSPAPLHSAPTVSVAAASPPRPISPGPVQAQSSAGSRLASPSIARVQHADSLAKPNPVASTASRSPSPLTTTQPLPQAAARTSSPAPTPNLDGVNDLIELVRASTQIEASDGTKEEIVRFLRNPRGYSEGPLSRADFWAFELRRQVLDVGERVDFIILYTREGTYKLKRSPTTEIPVKFARSFNHAPERMRGQTPAVDASLTLQASTVPVPLPVSAMSREQLEQEVTALRAQLATAATELATVRPLADETAKLRTEVATLALANKQLKNSRDSAQQDMAYIQEQYSIASTAASARAHEAAVAEAESARLHGLLDAGLKQKAAFYEAGIARSKLEVARMKKEVELVRVERRKMHEQGIREKAGKWDEVVARTTRKRRRAEDRKARIEAGAPADQDDDDDDDDLDSDEETVSSLLLGDRPKSPTPPATLPRDAIIKLAPDYSTAVGPSSSSDSSALPAVAPAVGYRCEWRGETQSQADPIGVPTATTKTATCDQLLPTQQALLEHAMTHVPST
ncbi:hypothetical protein JCM11491_006226 [Sporobolomyces phaffii]